MRGILLRTQPLPTSQLLTSVSILQDNAWQSLVSYQALIHYLMKKLKFSWLLMQKSKKSKPKKYPKGGNK
jgi:hypothetical protein